MIITNDTISALRTQVSDAFQKGYDQTPVFAPEISGKVSSSTASNTYAWVDVLPKMREWIGPRVYNNLVERAQVVINKEYEASLEVKRTDIEDDNLGTYKTRGQLMGRTGKKHPDFLVRDMFVAGLTTVCFDGQFLWDTDHPVNIEDSTLGTQSNKLALALSDANFATALAAGQSMKGADGESIGAFQDPTKTVLMVPPGLAATARSIVGLQTLAAGGANPNYGLAKVVVNPDLSDATAWYLLDMSFGDIAAVMLQERLPLEQSEQTAPDSDAVFTAGSFRYGLRWRGAAFAGLYWLGIYSKP